MPLARSASNAGRAFSMESVVLSRRQRSRSVNSTVCVIVVDGRFSNWFLVSCSLGKTLDGAVCMARAIGLSAIQPQHRAIWNDLESSLEAGAFTAVGENATVEYYGLSVDNFLPRRRANRIIPGDRSAGSSSTFKRWIWPWSAKAAASRCSNSP
jgi:hypothetical protein